MTGVAIKAGAPDWARMVSASKVGAILGVSPWQSQRALWHIMRGDAPDPFQGNDRTDMGHDLEDSIGNMWRRRYPRWRLSRGERQFTNPDLPFPHVATVDGIASRGSWRLILEKKTARDDDLGIEEEHWGPDGTDLIPAPYFVQVQFQMAVSGISKCHVAAFFSWFEFRVYPIALDFPLANHILDKCAEFHASLTGDVPPDLDDSTATLAVLKQLHPDIDGSTAPVDPAIGIEYVESGNALKVAEARDRLAKSRMYEAMGTAKYAEANGVRIGRRQPSGKSIALYHTKATTDQVREAQNPFKHLGEAI